MADQWSRLYTRVRALRVDQTENRLKKPIMIWRALHEYVNFVHDPEQQHRSLSEWSATGVRRPEMAARRHTRSAGSHISQFFDLLQFLGHQKIFYKTCICAVKVELNFLLIRKSY
eukprot:COSAG05_NODE_319_length_11483_cov_406.525604_9_plen_115_part_00